MDLKNSSRRVLEVLAGQQRERRTRMREDFFCDPGYSGKQGPTNRGQAFAGIGRTSKFIGIPFHGISMNTWKTAMHAKRFPRVYYAGVSMQPNAIQGIPEHSSASPRQSRTSFRKTSARPSQDLRKTSAVQNIPTSGPSDPSDLFIPDAANHM